MNVKLAIKLTLKGIKPKTKHGEKQTVKKI